MTLLSAAALAEIAEAVARRLPQHVTKRLYTVQEAAEYMGCSPQKIRNLVAEKALKNKSYDRFIRVAIEDMQRLIEEGKSA